MVLAVVAGDVLGGSSLLVDTRGSVAIEIMNSIPVDYACLGNHEFDHGDGELMDRIHESDFGWLGSNVYYPPMSSSSREMEGQGGGRRWRRERGRGGRWRGRGGRGGILPVDSAADDDDAFRRKSTTTANAATSTARKKKGGGSDITSRGYEAAVRYSPSVPARTSRSASSAW